MPPDDPPAPPADDDDDPLTERVEGLEQWQHGADERLGVIEASLAQQLEQMKAAQAQLETLAGNLQSVAANLTELRNRARSAKVI